MKLKSKKSGEEFSLSSIGISSGHGEFTRFTNEGSQVKITLKDSEGRIWKKDLSELMEEFKVAPEKAKTVFDLKEGDIFYMAKTCCGEIIAVEQIWFDTTDQRLARSIGGVFMTEAELKRELEREKARIYLEVHPKRFEECGDKQYEVCYDPEENEFFTCQCRNFKSIHNIYFASEKEAQKSINEDTKYWEQLFGVGVEK